MGEFEQLASWLGLTRVSGTWGGEYVGPCPYCVPGQVVGNDRFHVWPNNPGGPNFWCRACNTKAPLNKVLEDFSFKEKNKFFPNKKVERPQLPPPTFEVNDYVQYDYIYACMNNKWRSRVHKYYGQYGVPAKLCDEYLIGWDESYKGFVLPMPLYLKNREYMLGAQIRLENPPDEHHRFKSIPGGHVPGFTNSRLISLDFMENGEAGPQLPYLLITESIKDAVFLSGLGFYASAWKPNAFWRANVGNMLKNVVTPVIVQDADGERGLAIAKGLQQLIGPKAIRVSTISLGVKSPTDYIQANPNGESKIINLFEKLGVSVA